MTDNGRGYWGCTDHHPYELVLQLEDIAHRTTQVRRPQSNRLVERLHRTRLDEHFRVMGRSKWHESLEQTQTDLEAYLQQYNHKRPHQGHEMNGGTPFKAFVDGLPKPSKAATKRQIKAA